jgi:hypothetical protein
MQPGDDFEWDKDNEEKLAARHGVDRYEAEQAAVDLGASVKRIGTDRAGTPSTSSWERQRMAASCLW